MTSLKKLEAFVKKVQDELRRQKKIPADIARTGIVSDAAVSKLLNLKQDSVGYKMIEAISKTLDVPREVVQDWAGMNGIRKSVSNELTRQGTHIMEGYKHEETRRRAVRILEMLRDEENES
jgi:hypothetical protein